MSMIPHIGMLVHLVGPRESPSTQNPHVPESYRHEIILQQHSHAGFNQRNEPPQPITGKLQPVAANILMKILYGTRMASVDFLSAVCQLAPYITEWDVDCDRCLHRLVCYIASTQHIRMVGWAGDPLKDVEFHLYADADFAGCQETSRSTTGLFLYLQGPGKRFPLQGQTKQPSCVSHSAPEAGIVAADFALRTVGIPA